MAFRRIPASMRQSGPGRVLCLTLACAMLATPVVAAQEGTPPPAGGTLVVSIASDPGHFNPAITTGFTQHVVADSIFNGLVGPTKTSDRSPTWPTVGRSARTARPTPSVSIPACSGTTARRSPRPT